MLLSCLASLPFWGTTLPQQSVPIPAKLVEGIWYVQPVTSSGDTLTFYTDSGGGFVFLLEEVAQELDLPIEQVQMGGRTASVAPMPAFKANAWIPGPVSGSPTGEKLLTLPWNEETKQILPETASGKPLGSGFLGRWWFADRVWTFDYPQQHMYLHKGALPAESMTDHKALLGFQVDSTGRRTTHFPRIRVAVDGDSLDLLFDTGAQTTLTAAAQQKAGGTSGRRATSFITRSVFEKWQQKHPDWRVIEKAEAGTGAAMIEVPQVSIAGYTVGPVWFTQRPDNAFQEWLSQMMDKPIEGALGGSALQYFRVTADYPSAVAYFDKEPGLPSPKK
ncbi:hypothetical protein CLV24_13913 [Pontibacter ummariensis]|uniref:Aspartyl protease n=1 Tax=Pontibacter ummariensis TaxID=1610492 RepID=A0A239LD46_9BACT|nr:hypothetical protein [Pontibacter ummariensis]PRY03665.1 hypothetical protein CLV24_13913 [Pontibacter ummariensis]SNT28210.1 hypothetical protein SAMN06296052_13919 [Pontibacter ummariensis]